MKSKVLETFLFGVTLGIGITILSLYTQKPGSLVASIETIAEKGRARRAKGEQEKLRRERLQSMGFRTMRLMRFPDPCRRDNRSGSLPVLLHGGTNQSRAANERLFTSLPVQVFRIVLTFPLGFPMLFSTLKYSHLCPTGSL